MLLELRVENYRSIAEEQRLLLTAKRDDSLPENVLSIAADAKFDLLKSAVIYGANGAGKSNLIRAAELIRHLVVHSATDYQADEPLPLEPFRLDPGLHAAPSTFEISFIHDGTRYQYGLKVDRQRIHGEWLFAYPEGRPQKWFLRDGQSWTFGPALRGEKKRIADLTRNNALFVSVAASFNHQQISRIFRWFDRQFQILAPNRLAPTGMSRVENVDSLTARRARQDIDFKTKIARLLSEADTGIHDLDIEIKRLGETDFPSDFPPRVKEALMSSELNRVKTLHRTRDGRQDVWFNLHDESDGTRNLFELAAPWLDSIDSGCTVLVDDVFSNVHPLLTRQLLSSFHRLQSAEHPAQVILTTHDTTLLDPTLLRRDQIWFVEKDRGGASRVYSLLDYSPRKDEAFARGYLSGRYGAIPFLGDFQF